MYAQHGLEVRKIPAAKQINYWNNAGFDVTMG